MKYVIRKTDQKVVAFLKDPKGYNIEWHKGSHTANLYNKTNDNVDVFTFRWDINTPSVRDFRDALETYLEFGVPAHV